MDSEGHDPERAPRRRPRRGWSRTGLTTLLVGLNAVLSAALVLSATRLSPALAQVGGTRGEYICATAKPSGFSYDVLYVLDFADHRLHAFRPGVPKTRKLVKASSRDLLADFAKDKQP